MTDDLLQCKILTALLLWNNVTVSAQLWIKGSGGKRTLKRK